MINSRPESSSKPRSVLLIFNDTEKSKPIATALEAMPEVRVDSHSGTLTAMNGSVVKLAAGSDLVIFETSGQGDDDVAAAAALRHELDHSARLLAVTAEDTSLAVARRLMRAGVDDVLTVPLDMHELRSQVDRWTRPNPLVAVPAVPQEREGRVITVAKARGGAGATTVAVNLADQLLQRSGMVRKSPRNRVALIDLDLQFGAAASFLDVDPKQGLFQLATDGHLPDLTFLRQSISETESGIDLLSAPSRFAPIDALKPEQVATLLDLLRREYDYLVVDLPQTLVQWLSPVLKRTDTLLLVTDSSVPSIRQARRLIDFFTDEHVGLRIEIVVNQEKKPMIKGRTCQEAEKVLERRFRHWLPSDARLTRTATDRGAPLSAVSGGAALKKAIGLLGRQMLSDLPTPDAMHARDTLHLNASNKGR